jgi:DNA repair exonuclease SbcCD ATPase subunit
MQHMINRQAFFVVILLSSLSLAGCSGVFGPSPGERADQAINDANESIAEHNRLFDQARATYTDVKQEIEAGNDPSAQQDRITESREKMEEARSNLQDARDSLDGVNDLDVDPAVKRYASTLSDAMEAQISAEDREIEFYSLLEEDPALENSRDEAENLLQQVGDDYERAEQAYAKARDLADENPELIESTNGS